MTIIVHLPARAIGPVDTLLASRASLMLVSRPIIMVGISLLPFTSTMDILPLQGRYDQDSMKSYKVTFTKLPGAHIIIHFRVLTSGG